MTKQPASPDEFIKLLTEHQSQLMGYIMASLGNHANAMDVLQQTNIVLWQKSEELRCRDEFLPWALTVAKYKVLSFVRDEQRDRLVFTPEVTRFMLEASDSLIESFPERLRALRLCLSELPEPKLRIITRRYGHNESLKEIAASRRLTVESLKGRLKRIRRSLAKCVNRRLALEERLG